MAPAEGPERHHYLRTLAQGERSREGILKILSTLPAGSSCELHGNAAKAPTDAVIGGGFAPFEEIAIFSVPAGISVDHRTYRRVENELLAPLYFQAPHHQHPVLFPKILAGTIEDIVEMVQDDALTEQGDIRLDFLHAYVDAMMREGDELLQILPPYRPSPFSGWAFPPCRVYLGMETADRQYTLRCGMVESVRFATTELLERELDGR